MSLYPKAVTEYVTLAGIPRGYGSKIFVVDTVNGSDSNAGDRWTAPLKSVAAAFALCVSGRHDTVLVIASPTADVLTAALAWNKSETHLLGLGAPTMLSSRARLFQTGVLTLSPLITISGQGCIFKNIYVSQEAADAGSLIAVDVTGGRNYFENCMFAGGGAVECAIAGGTNLALDGGEENLFKNCVIGRDSIADATGWAAMTMTNYAVRNIFDGCLFQMYAGATSTTFVKVLINTGLDRWNWFKDCRFFNSCRTYAVASLFTVPGSMTGFTNYILADNCESIGVSELESANRGVVMTTGHKPDAGGGTTGIAITASTT